MAGGTLVIRFIGDLNHFQKSTAALGKRVSATGAKLTKGLTLPIVAMGVGVLKVSADFEKGMNKVQAVSGASGTSLDKLREQAKHLGATTEFTATEAADAMGFLAMAGFKANDIMGAMPSTLNLATAGAIDLGRAADITSNILTGYGMEVKDLGHANDVLTKTFTSTNTSLDQLGEAFKYAAPVAKSAGVQFEEASAAIGLMGNAGIQGTMAGTSLRGAISRLLNPTGTAAKALKKLGIQTKDSSGKLLPLNQIIGQLEKSGAKTGDMMTIFGQRAGPAMAALVSQGSGAMRKLTRELENSDGTTKKTSETMRKGLTGGLQALKSAAEGFAIAIGEAGALEGTAKGVEKLTAGVRGLTKWFNGLSGEQKKWLGILVLTLAALGPVIWIIGKFISMGVALAKVIRTIIAVKGAWATVTAFLGKHAVATRIQLAALKVQTLAQAAASKVAAGASRVWAAAMALGNRMALKTRIQLGLLAVQTAAVAAAQKVAAVAAKVWAGAQKLLNLALTMNPIGLVIAAIALLVAGFIVAYKKSDTFRKLVNKAFALVVKAAKAVAGWFTKHFVPFFTKKLPKAFNTVIKWVRRHWPKILAILAGPIGIAALLIIKHWNKITGKFKKAWGWVSRTWKRGWNKVKTVIGDAVQRGKDAVVNQWNKITGKFSSAWSWVNRTFRKWWSGIRQLLTNPIQTAKNVLQRLLGPGGAMRTVFSKAVDAIRRIWGGLQSAARKPVAFVVNTVYTKGIKRAVDAIPGVKNLPDLKFAKGGEVPTWMGQRGKDSIHALLMPGEHVWTAEEVRKAGGHEALEMMRKSVMRGEFRRTYDPPKFAKGGGIPAERINAAHGFARRQHGKPYIWGGVGPGGYDCSGFMSAITNVLRGQNPYSRVGTSATFPWAGFKPGWGQFTVGAFTGSPGHVAGTLDGVNVESSGFTQYGRGARGAGHSMFTRLAHLGAGGKGAAKSGKFFGAMNALKDLVGDMKSWWGKLKDMGRDWGPMMAGMGKSVAGSVVKWIKKKIPGSGLIGKLFDGGGILGSGQLAANMSGRPERVLDPRTTQSFERLVRVLNDQAFQQALTALGHGRDLTHIGSRRLGGAQLAGVGGRGGGGGEMRLRGQLELRGGEAYVSGIAEYVVADALDLQDTSDRMGRRR